MQIVYNAENLIDANLVRDLLEQAGIKSFVNGEYLSGAMGELPAHGLVTVSVSDPDQEKASAVIQEFRARREGTAGETRWDMNDGLGDWMG